jgi:ABC-2 type transport system ATP-binding protein
MIEVENVTKNYGPVRALAGLSCSIPRGQIVGLLGPNGAGKTTLLKILTTYFEPTSGSARLDGHDVVTEPLAVRQRVGYLPENAPLYQEMLVQESLLMTADLRGIPPGERGALISRAVRDADIADVLTRPIGQLSKGYRQRVGLAQAILHRPPILILDEPTSGLDPDQIVEVRQLVRRLAETSTVILSTHILSEVEQTCERVLILINGALKADAELAELTASNRFRLGLAAGADAEAVAAELRGAEGITGVRSDGGEGLVRLQVEAAQEVDLGRRLFELAKAKDWPLRELRPDSRTLESVFRSLSSGASEAFGEEVAL